MFNNEKQPIWNLMTISTHNMNTLDEDCKNGNGNESNRCIFESTGMETQTDYMKL